MSRFANSQTTTAKTNTRRLSSRDILLLMISALLLLTLLSSWYVCDIYAKYIVSEHSLSSARVAKTGVGKLELWESNATLESGIYVLDEDDPVKENTYDHVIPGVDIAKDPYVLIKLDKSEVDYQLYIKVVKSDPFPEYVTYDLTEDWEPVAGQENVYRYKKYFDADAGTSDWKIPILKNDKLYVSEHYSGGEIPEFTLTFNVWLAQVD